MEENDIKQQRSHKEKRGETERRRKRGSWDTKGAGNSHPRTKNPFSLGHMAV